MDNEILCWDVRYSDSPVFRFARTVNTNQRIGFSINSSGTHLATASREGLLVFDLNTLSLVKTVDGHEGEWSG